METNSPHVTQLNRITLWWSEILLNKRTLLFASTVFNSRRILTPYISHKAHTHAVHVNTTTLLTLSLFRISHFIGGISKKWRLIGEEWSRQRQSTNYFPLKAQYAALTVWYWPINLKTGCGTNPKSNLPSWAATYNAPFPRRSSLIHFFRRINTQGCKMLHVCIQPCRISWACYIIKTRIVSTGE